MRRRLFILVLIAVFLVILLATMRVGRAPVNQKLRVKLMEQGMAQPSSGWVNLNKRSGKNVPTNSFPVIQAEITNATAKTYTLYCVEGGQAVWCEYRDRVGSGWTNWTPALGAIRGQMVLKPHSWLIVDIKLREDRGERQARIICTPQIPSARLPNFLGDIERRFYRLLFGPRIKVPVALPPNNTAPPIGGRTVSSEEDQSMRLSTPDIRPLAVGVLPCWSRCMIPPGRTISLTSRTVNFQPGPRIE
jgi:hypothetical protein